MKVANVSYAKAHLSGLIARVKQGERITIVERRKPVASLQPLGPEGGEGSDWMDDLVRRGLVAPAREGLDPAKLFRLPRPRWRGGKPLSAHLATDREDRV